MGSGVLEWQSHLYDTPTPLVDHTSPSTALGPSDIQSTTSRIVQPLHFCIRGDAREGNHSRTEIDVATGQTAHSYTGALSTLWERRQRFCSIMKSDQCAYYVAIETTRDTVLVKGISKCTSWLSRNYTEYLNSVVYIYFSCWDFLFGCIVQISGEECYLT